MLLLVSSAAAAEAVRQGLALCVRSVIPALFPYFVVSGLFTSLGFAGGIGRRLAPVTERLFGVGGAGASALFLGFLGGYPVGGRTVGQLFRSGALSQPEAERLLAFCNNAGPSFILGVVGLGCFGSLRAGVILYLLHILSALLVGVLLKKRDRPRVNFRLPLSPPEKFLPAFLRSVQESADAMLHLCAFVVFALVVQTLLAGLTACKGRETIAEAQAVHVVTAPTDDATFVYEPEDPTQVLPGGQTIALVTGPGGTDSGEDAMLWQGVQTFANTYHYTAVSQTAAGSTADDAEAALRAAAESGAKLVVCRGEVMGQALYRIQENYPDVHYLLFDDEPHNDDYSAYKTANLVHCVLFQEEQAGYLAGYAAVTEGYTALGFVGTREVPGIVRYATGFLQGAEAAAEQQGERVSLQTWFADTDTVNDAITQRMIDWYNNGTTLIMVSGGDLYTGVANAVNQTGAKAITTDCDRTDQGDRILASAVKCYNAAVQRELYTFFVQGTWDAQSAGQTEKTGFTNGEVALQAGSQWRLDNFSQESYRKLYEKLRTSALRVDTYSDLDTLPDTPNVTLTRLR